MKFLKKVIVGLIILLLIVFIGLKIVLYMIVPDMEAYKQPQLYRAATSPDKTWSVEVWRVANEGYPLRDGVDVIVVVKDEHGQELKRKVIDTRDMWEDVEEQYSEVIITNTEIKIGPHRGGYDPTKPSYYIVKKRELHFKGDE